MNIPKLYITLMLAFFLFGCARETNNNNELSPEELNDFIQRAVKSDAVVENTNDSSIVGKTFLESMKFWFDPDEYKNCKSDNLKSLKEIVNIDLDLQQHLKKEFSSDGEKMKIEKILDYASTVQDGITPYQQDKITTFLLHEAALQGDAIAMNEIGASLLFCYQGVNQNFEQAEIWLTRSFNVGDEYAAHNLARMHLAGVTSTPDPEKEALRLLRTCSLTDHPECKDSFQKLRRDIRAQD